MSCDPELVTGYVDGELSPRVRGEVENHASFCSACSAQARFETTLRARLRALQPDRWEPTGGWRQPARTEQAITAPIN
jgi:anti-sigma factor RsiW